MSTKRRINLVDLTGDEEPTSESTRKSYTAPTDGQELRARQSVVDLSQGEPSTQMERDEELNAMQTVQDSRFDETAYLTSELYSHLETKVVGVRFYNGRATIGECVLIKRDRNNKYDSNAVRIDNVMGDQIGHLPRVLVSRLAPYMDSNELLVEGTLSGEIGAYDCPITLHLYGTSEPGAREQLMEKMQGDRLPTTVVKAAIRKQKQDLAKKAKEDAAKMRANARALAQQKKGDLMSANLSQGTEQTQQTESLDELLSQSIAFNPRETEKIVEKFGMDETELSQMPMAECPPQLSTELLPYQRQGLAWMLDRESPSLPNEGTDDIVQLWKRVGKRYMNIATNYSSSTAPPLASGGILADDMGLGKTIQVISLILANSTPKTPKSSKATLIISPLGVMSNWRDQIEAHIHKEHALRVLTYHGSGKKEAANLSQYDVVITTYGALASEYGQLLSATGKLAKTKRGLFSVRWRRVVLDEGHTIRTPKTKAACAACMLEADSRWSLTGTPIVNNLKDLYSQGKFIRLSGGLEDLPVFHSALIRPLNAGDENASLLLQALMATICLRRRKDMSFVNLRLPPMESHILHVKFLPHEKEKYEMFEAEAKGVFMDFQSNNKGKKTTYSHVLEVLLRLRQVCNHWKLCHDRVKGLMELLEKDKVVKLTPENVKALQAVLQLRIESQEECSICLESLDNPVITPCAHAFDYSCIEQTIELQHKCPLCRAEIKDCSELVSPAADLGEDCNQVDVESDTLSSKIQALIKILTAKGQAAGTKTVVFSQWTSFLDLIEPHLVIHNINFARIDGKMNSAKRDAAMGKFSRDSECTVMLASLNVCSVGLNLVAANQVVLADSWWAPAIEDQAVDRVYRLGQTRPTTIWRLVMENSIEDRVLDIQKEKWELMSTAFQEKAGPKDQARRSRLADLEKLLR